MTDKDLLMLEIIVLENKMASIIRLIDSCLEKENFKKVAYLSKTEECYLKDYTEKQREYERLCHDN